jgi:hypothetical protein
MEATRARVDRGELHEAITRIRLMPDAVRQFTVGTGQAAAGYDVDGELLDLLCAAGLPVRGAGDERRFDPLDLQNVALDLNLGSRYRRMLGWWVRELERPTGDTAAYRLDYGVECPAQGHPSPCRYGVLLPVDRRIRKDVPDPSPCVIANATFSLLRRWPPLPPTVIDLLDEVRTVRFMRLPLALQDDLDFIEAYRLGDCLGVARLLVRQARQRGLAARFCYGRALTPPVSTGHFWAELHIEGVWIPVDPVFIDALRRWGVMHIDRWSPYHSLGGILGRLAGRPRHVALHGRRPIDAKLSAYRLPVN